MNYNLFFILDLFSAIFNFLLGYYVFLKDSKRSANRGFFFLTLTATIWCASVAGLRALGFFPFPGQGLLEENLEIIKRYSIGWIWNQISWIGITFLPSTFLHLSIIVTAQKGFFQRKEFILTIYLISLSFLIYTFWTEPFTPPIFYILFSLFFISCLLISFILLLKKYISVESITEKNKLKFFIIGFSIPAVLGTLLDVIYPLLKYGMFVGTTFSHYFFTLGYVFIGLAVLRYGLFLDFQEILENIFRKMTEMALITDRGGTILMTNEKILEKLQCKEEEILGKKIGDFLVGGEKKFKEILEKLQKGETYQGKINFLSKEGQLLPFWVTFSFVKAGIVFVGQDLGEILRYQERLEKEVEKRTKELQQKIIELEEYYKLTVGRELKMLELKNEVERLKKELEKYKKKT